MDRSYDEAKQTFTLDVKQALPPTPGQPSKHPVLIPLAVALLGPDGKELHLRLQVGACAEPAVGSPHIYSLNCGTVPTSWWHAVPGGPSKIFTLAPQHCAGRVQGLGHVDSAAGGRCGEALRL